MNTEVHVSFQSRDFVFSWYILGVRLLDRVVIAFLVLKGTSMLVDISLFKNISLISADEHL